MACACFLVPAAPAAAQTGTSDGRRCAVEPTGLTLSRWRDLDGMNGPLGCPKGPAVPIEGRAGVATDFDHGQIVTSPEQGPEMAVAAYQQHDDLIVYWNTTKPHEYEKFILRWSRDGKHAGQTDLKKYVGRRGGFFSFDAPLPGVYSFVIEGCVMKSGRSRCRQGFTAPVTARFALPALPGYATCQGRSKPEGFIADRWARAGGAEGPLGCQTNPATPAGNATVATFDGGQIVHSPAQGEGMTVAVYQRGDKLRVDWGSTNPHSYDKFIVRWDRDGRNVGQEDRNFERDGSWEKKVDPGTYTVRVRGCVRRYLRSSKCKQGFTAPATATVVATPAPPPVPDPIVNLDFTGLQTPTTLEAALEGKQRRATRAARFVACRKPLGDVYNDEDDFMNIAIAKLFLAHEEAGTRCPGSRFRLADEVSNAIRHQEIKSEAGTELEECGRKGEYDVALKGYVALVYRYARALAPDVRYRITHHLLNKRGPYDSGDSSIGCVVTIPESENHQMLIESSRYLTNQLLHRVSGLARYDNRHNRKGRGPTMDQHMLRVLRGFLTADFQEYNSKPYQRYTWSGIQNLADYAETAEVKLAARMVLDYVSAKVAVSTLDGRRNPPFRRNASNQGVELFDLNSDPLKGRFMLYTAPTAVFGELPEPRGWVPWHAAADMVLMAATSYEPPRPVLELMVNATHRTFYQRLHHYVSEVYASEKEFLISGGGTARGHSTTFAGRGKADDLGITPPTFLAPAGRFVSLANMIRFDNPRKSSFAKAPGLCVAPRFACGLNPVVPQVYTPADRTECWKREEAAPPDVSAVTFIDFASPACRRQETPGFYATVVDVGGKFGFVEAVPKSELANVSLADYAHQTKQRNAAHRYGSRRTNDFTTWKGNTIRFDLRRANPIVSTGLAEIDGLPKDPSRWDFAAGTVINSKAGSGLVTIVNPATGGRVTLDFRDAMRPKREG